MVDDPIVSDPPPPPVTVLQPNPAPVVQVRALDEVEHEGMESGVGAADETAPRTELGVIVAREIVPALVIVPPARPVPAVILLTPPPPPLPLLRTHCTSTTW